MKNDLIRGGKTSLILMRRSHPDHLFCSCMAMCRLEAGTTYVMFKARLPLQLAEPYSETWKQIAREKVEEQVLLGRM